MNKKVSQEAFPILAPLVATVGGVVAKMIIDKLAATSPKKVIDETKEVLRTGQSSDLVRVTQSARIEPILLIDQRATTAPFVQDVINTLFNMYTSYWLLAVSLDTKINGVTVGQRLDRFATDRDLANATISMLGMPTLESLDIGLPYAKEILQTSFEAQNGAPGSNREGTSVIKPGEQVQAISNLAVGKVVEVKIEENGQSATVPVSIRLRVAGMNSKTIVQTLAVGGADVTMGGRWRAWRAGEIKFWADFVLQMDRVDAHRAAALNDETGYYKAIYKRANRNALASLLTGGPSVSTASSIIVIDESSRLDLEREIGGQLSNFRTRQEIFGATYSILLAIVDKDWESITVYTRGIEQGSTYTVKDIKSGGGSSDSKEIMDMLKAFQAGRAPGR